MTRIEHLGCYKHRTTIPTIRTTAINGDKVTFSDENRRDGKIIKEAISVDEYTAVSACIFLEQICENPLFWLYFSSTGSVLNAILRLNEVDISLYPCCGEESRDYALLRN